jgi:hypothetical protein
MATCAGCGGPTLLQFPLPNQKGGESMAPMCVPCFKVISDARHRAIQDAKQQMNFLVGQMEMITGIPGFHPRYPDPEPPILQAFAGPITNFNVGDGATVGAINTGSIRDLDVNITALREQGEVDIADGLKAFGQAVLAEKEIDEATRNELLEQVDHVSKEARKSKPVLGTVKAVLGTIRATATTVGGLAAAWDKLHPILAQYFPSVFS